MAQPLPQHVFDRLNADEYLQLFDRVIERFHLSLEEFRELAIIGSSIVYKEHTVAELSTLIAQALPDRAQEADDIALDYIGFQLVPVLDYVEGVAEFISSKKGDLAYFQKFARAVLTPEAMLFERLRYMLSSAGRSAEEYSPQERHNYFALLLSLVNGSITSEQVFGVLIQPVDSGGLGFDKDIAQKAAERMVLEVGAGAATLEMFKEIDDLRKQILGDQYTSIIEGQTVTATDTNYQVEKLKEQYQTFIQRQDVVDIVSAVVNTSETQSVKEQLYEAINTKDQGAFLEALGILFSSGTLKQLFKNDERYIAFWRPRVLKAEGLEVIRVFDENPARPKYLGAFVKFVLEKRFDMKEEESVLWGVYLSSVAHHAGDYEYEHLAYGDTNTETFVWSV